MIVIPGDEQFPSPSFDLIFGMTQQFSNGIDAAMAKHILCQQINTETSKPESKYAFGFDQISLHKKSSDLEGTSLSSFILWISIHGHPLRISAKLSFRRRTYRPAPRVTSAIFLQRKQLLRTESLIMNLRRSLNEILKMSAG